MTSEAEAVRTQILSNAKIMLKPEVMQQVENDGNNGNNGNNNGADNGHKTTTSTADNPSQATLIGPHSHHELDVVVFGHGGEFTAAVMWGLTPAVQGAAAPTTDGALRRLLLATAEMLHNYIPKIGTHQRAIHGGGVFNEDLISQEINAARKMSV